MTRIRILIVLVASAVGLVAVAPTVATGTAPKPAPDVTVLFGQALKEVRAQPEFAKAVVLEVDGTTSGNDEVTDAAGITKWQFVFQNGGGSKFLSVTLKYKASSGFAKPKGHKSPFLEDVVIHKAPKMTLDDAVGLLNDAGYNDGFTAVTLRNPLGPDKSQPLYIFTLANGDFVGVDTKTGDVDPLS